MLTAVNVICFIIFCVFVVGFISTLISIKRIQSESSKIIKVWSAQSFDVRDNIRINPDSYTNKRLDVILAGHYSGRIPSASDLHTLTLRDEMSTRSSCASKIITSSLVILGVAGTVLGIHETLSESAQTIDLALLRPALMPSFWAIAGTIVLLIMRIFYIRAFNHFLCELDFVTSSVYLPSCKSNTALNGTLSELRSAVDGMRALVSDFNNQIIPITTAIISTGESIKSWSDCAESYIQASSDISNVATQFKETCNTILQRESDAQDKLDKSLETLSLVNIATNSLIESVKNVSIHHQMLTDTTTFISTKIGDYGKALGQVNKNTEDTNTNLQNACTGAIKLFDDTKTTLNQMIENASIMNNELKTSVDSFMKELSKNNEVLAFASSKLDGSTGSISDKLKIAESNYASVDEKLANIANDIEEIKLNQSLLPLKTDSYTSYNVPSSDNAAYPHTLPHGLDEDAVSVVYPPHPITQIEPTVPPLPFPPIPIRDYTVKLAQDTNRKSINSGYTTSTPPSSNNTPKVNPIQEKTYSRTENQKGLWER